MADLRDGPGPGLVGEIGRRSPATSALSSPTSGRVSSGPPSGRRRRVSFGSCRSACPARCRRAGTPTLGPSSSDTTTLAVATSTATTWRAGPPRASTPPREPSAPPRAPGRAALVRVLQRLGAGEAAGRRRVCWRRRANPRRRASRTRPSRRCRAPVPGRAGRRPAIPHCRPRPRRPGGPPPRRLLAARPGLGRPRLRRRHGQLPRQLGLRARVEGRTQADRGPGPGLTKLETWRRFEPN